MTARTERIDMAVFGPLPAFVRISVRLRGADPERGRAPAAALLARSAPGDVAPDDARLAAWRDAYERVGLGPDVTPPPAALLAWAETERGVPSQGTLPDLVNAFALQHVVPAAAYDLAAAEGDLWLRPSRGIEHYVPLGRDVTPDSPPINELILADSADRVLARHWHGAPSRPTLPGPTASEVLLHVDLLPPLTAQADELTDAIVRLATGFTGAEAEVRRLTRQQPQAAWPA